MSNIMSRADSTDDELYMSGARQHADSPLSRESSPRPLTSILSNKPSKQGLGKRKSQPVRVQTSPLHHHDQQRSAVDKRIPLPVGEAGQSAEIPVPKYMSSAGMPSTRTPRLCTAMTSFGVPCRNSAWPGQATCGIVAHIKQVEASVKDSGHEDSNDEQSDNNEDEVVSDRDSDVRGTRKNKSSEQPPLYRTAFSYKAGKAGVAAQQSPDSRHQQHSENRRARAVRVSRSDENVEKETGGDEIKHLIGDMKVMIGDLARRLGEIQQMIAEGSQVDAGEQSSTRAAGHGIGAQGRGRGQ